MEDVRDNCSGFMEVKAVIKEEFRVGFYVQNLSMVDSFRRVGCCPLSFHFPGCGGDGGRPSGVSFFHIPGGLGFPFRGVNKDSVGGGG